MKAMILKLSVFLAIAFQATSLHAEDAKASLEAQLKDLNTKVDAAVSKGDELKDIKDKTQASKVEKDLKAQLMNLLPLFEGLNEKYRSDANSLDDKQMENVVKAFVKIYSHPMNAGNQAFYTKTSEILQAYNRKFSSSTDATVQANITVIRDAKSIDDENEEDSSPKKVKGAKGTKGKPGANDDHSQVLNEASYFV